MSSLFVVGFAVDGCGVVGLGVGGAVVVLGDGRLVKHIPVGICCDVYFRMKSALSTPLCISYLFRIKYSVPSQFFLITFNFQILIKQNKITHLHLCIVQFLNETFHISKPKSIFK